MGKLFIVLNRPCFLVLFLFEQVNEEAFWAPGLNEHKGFLKLLDKEKNCRDWWRNRSGTILRGLKTDTELNSHCDGGDDGGSSDDSVKNSDPPPEISGTA